MTNARQRYFEELQNILQDQKFHQKNLKLTLKDIQIAFSFKGGLFNHELRILALFMCATNLAPTINDEVIKCMVPNGPVSDDVLDMLLVAILSRRKTAAHLKFSKLILQWLLSVLDFGCAQLEPFRKYYHLYYSLLAYSDLDAYACKMIYKLTKPIDVTQIAIKKVLNHYCSARKVHMAALLRYFANFKPNYIGSELKEDHINVEELFQSLPQDSSYLFAMVHNRTNLIKNCQVLVPMIDLQDSPNIQETQLNPFPVEKVNKLIPAISYSFPLNDKLSILPYESIDQLGQMVVRVAIPDQILSLLNNQIGHFKLMTCSETDQKRFSERLFDTLKQAFLEKEGDSSIEEKEYFLDQIFSLCNFMQQGISTCTMFLGSFLLTWSGFDFRSQIFHLIEWTVVDSYSELFLILKNLHMLFVTSNIAVKCLVIRTLAHLVGNMGKTFYRLRNKIDLPFMKSQIPSWTKDAVTMFQQTIKFIDDLIQIGLCTEPDSSILLDSVVYFYESVSCYEDISGLPLVTVVPKGVVYRCFFNKNIMFLDRIAGLLLNYKEQFNELQGTGLELHFIQHKELCDLYLRDIINTLWFGEGFDKRESGIIFRMLSYDMISNITMLNPSNPNILFNCHNYMPLLLKEKDEMLSNLPDDVCEEEENRYNLLKMYAPNIAKLVDLFRN